MAMLMHGMRRSMGPSSSLSMPRMITTSVRMFNGRAMRSSPPISFQSVAMIRCGQLRNALQPNLSTQLRKQNTVSMERWTLQQYSLRKQFYQTRARYKKPISAEAVIAGLISVNCIVTMMWLRSQASYIRQRRMVMYFTTSAQHLQDGKYYTLLTSVFSHASLSHLLTNMVGLFFFGRQICEVLGPKRFLGLYLVSGVVSSYAAVYEQRLARRPSLNLGASGAVNSITALSVLFFPFSTWLIFGIVPMPAWLAGSLFIFKDAYSWSTDQRDGIGHFAHLSGAFCGGAYYLYLRKGINGLRRF